MFIVHELLESGEVWPIPSENIGSEGSKTGCLPILKCSELGVMAPERALFSSLDLVLEKKIECINNTHLEG